MPIKISIVDDVTSFLRGAGKAEDALDDVADSLDDLARDASRGAATVGDDLARGISSGAGKAEDSVGDLERSFREMARDAGRYSKDAGDDVGKNVKQGSDRASEATAEFKDEAKQNFSEVASSFTGDMDSAIDLVQGTLGGLAGSIPGVGIALGGLAAGAGAFYSAWSENAEKTEERIGTMFDDMVESGRRYISDELITQNLRDIYLRTDDAVIKWAELEKVAKVAGLTQQDVALAYAGDAEAGKRLTQGLADAQRALGDEIVKAGAKGNSSMLTQQQEQQRMQRGWEAFQDSVTIATQRATDFGIASRAAGREATSGVDATDLAVARLGQRIADLPASRKVTVVADVDDRAVREWAQRPVRLNVVARPGAPAVS